ncbi:MAG: hypothetical protein K5829_08925 [Treponema sp.]|nr:hypothetical protein [Treponema sp.]
MDELEFSKIIDLITQATGIIPRDSHKTGIKNYINKRLEELKDENEKFEFSYFKYLLTNNDELFALINNATVNETYFFREEAQFLLLQNKIFPEIKLKKGGEINIWSAAASSGEEIYSLYLLATLMGLKANCTASDINTHVLEICEKGNYKKNSIRSVDGAAFHKLLQPYKTEDECFQLPEEITNKINRKQINLSKFKDFPVNQDIIFIRNVFIYFSLDMRKKILQKLVNECLADGGYLFVSMNEVASVDATIVPKELEKIVDGKIFYFHKKE